MNIFVYILGRIPPKKLLAQQSEAQYSRLAGLWCHSMQMVCTEYSVCVECTVCVSYERSSIGLNYINIVKRPVEQWEGELVY